MRAGGGMHMLMGGRCGGEREVEDAGRVEGSGSGSHWIGNR